MPLTILKVKNAKRGRHVDGRGLCLLVKPSGARTWMLRMQLNGQRRDFGLGSAYDVSLAEAREAAALLRRQVRTAAVQHQRTIKAAAAGVLIGGMLWASLAGPIARSLPERWQLPERMAQRALGAPTLVDAGARLLQSADPARWDEVIEAARLSADNREAINRCKGLAKKERRAVNCQLRIGS